MKLIISVLLLLFSATVSADELPNPDEDNLANYHLKDEECAGACHEKEGPSDDLEFELQACIECHGVMTEVGGKPHNIKHQDEKQMDCVECHLPHEEFDPREICSDCHDDDENVWGETSWRSHKHWRVSSLSDKVALFLP